MSTSLYRKYRPQNFASVVGQKAAVSVLTNSLAKGITGHAYLFSGSRGCGKTSVARIFAKALNCLDPQGYEPCGKCKNCEAITAGESLDVIEIDGASNNGVENIRGLRENASLAPFSSKHKIYIIDEVHMLSQGAFNALLKTLEEPPEYVVFILATTDPQKVPVTIRSRCQHIPFHSISPEDIFSRLNYVCGEEGLTAESEALYEISRQADGALRDALSLLEQIAASGEITLANIEAVLGAGSRPAFERWLKTLRTDPPEAYALLKAMFDAGASCERVFEEMFSLVRNLWLVSKWGQNIIGSLGLSNAEKKFLLDEVNYWKPDALHSLLNNILRSLSQARSKIRSDILLGIFMLSLEPPPKAQAVIDVPKISQHVQTPEVIQEHKEIPAEYDESLKLELLNKIHDVNFTLYCLMLDVKSAKLNGKLFLDAEHAYCFDRMKLDANSSVLAKTFSDYGKVILRHDREEKLCVILDNLLDQIEQPKQESPAPKNEPELLTQKTPEEKTPEESHAPEQKILQTSHEPSVFSKYRHKLMMMGANLEILLVKHKEESESDESENDDTSSDETQEGDNEE